MSIHAILTIETTSSYNIFTSYCLWISYSRRTREKFTLSNLVNSCLVSFKIQVKIFLLSVLTFSLSFFFLKDLLFINYKEIIVKLQFITIHSVINNVLQSVFIELNEGIDFIFIIDKYNRKDLAGVASNALFFLFFWKLSILLIYFFRSVEICTEMFLPCFLIFKVKCQIFFSFHRILFVSRNKSVTGTMCPGFFDFFGKQCRNVG